MLPSFTEIWDAVHGCPAETKKTWDRQDRAIDDFRSALGPILVHLEKRRALQFDRGDWTFTVNPEPQQFSAVLRGDWTFPGHCQNRIDRILTDAGLLIVANVEDMRVWVAECPRRAA